MPRVRAPRIPRKRLWPGLSEPAPAGAQYALDAVFRASGTARVPWEITGPGPGETDSDVSLQQNPAACWTRMEDSHVRAGEVAIRKTPGHGTTRRGRFIKGRPEQFCCTAQLKLPLSAQDPEIKPQHAPGFPCRPCRLQIVSCFSALLPSSMSHPYPTHFHF
jgi:hypothetical protein